MMIPCGIDDKGEDVSRKKFSADFQIPRPVDELFPLFSAEGEKLWVPGWDYKNIMGSTDLHEDYIFLTQNHDHASADAIWLVKRYQPETHLVQFYKVEPNEKVGIITVQCEAVDAEETRVEVSYEYVGLSQTGDDFIDGFSESEYREYIAEWERLLLEYFATVT